MNDGTIRCPHGKKAERVARNDIGPGWVVDEANCELCHMDTLFTPTPYFVDKTASEQKEVADELTKEAQELGLYDDTEDKIDDAVSEAIDALLDNPEAFGVHSKATGPNPKDIVGSSKISITKLPAAGIIHGARAMMDGAKKYGPYNWREKDISASIYVDAAIRHLLDWFEGEENAPDSKAHHLGHALACCAILLDAQENNCLLDDRPILGNSKGVASRILEKLRKTL